jgi:ABC-type amino acid transport substrate-binding protein
MQRRDFMQRASLLGLGLAGATLGLDAQAQAPADGPTALEKVRARGRLIVGLYNELAPFHDAGIGIEVGLAKALAERLGVQATLLPFTAGENMDDDLRNMVWKGHYLGYGPADVLLHVPVDRPLMDANPQVQVFGPYWRERVVIARDLSKLPELDGIEPLRKQRIAVPGLSLAGWLMIGAEGGALREQLVTKLKDGIEAAQMLQRGEVAAACGLRSEMVSALHGDARFAITPLPLPRAPRDGWAVGMAVKKSSGDLARALQTGLNELGTQGDLKRLFAGGGLDWQTV